tara:strand:- start:133 stop:1068 length:936 start_codon:yes stop_codon:yes gene_type:complete
MDRILITGGAGFIGTNLINKLLARENVEIYVIDNFLYQIHYGNINYNPKVNYIVGCVTDKKVWERALSFDIDYIVHLASETGTGQSMDELSSYTNTNINGTSVMLECLNTIPNKVKKITLSSSRAVYGNYVNTETITHLNPVSIYAFTKLAQEKLLKISSTIPYTILRYQNVYGPGQSIHNPYTGIISIFSKRFSMNQDVDIWDNGKPTRDFIYIDDVTDLTLKVIENNNTDYGIFNVGTGISTKIIDVANLLKESINPLVNINISSYHREGDILHAVADMQKTFNLFNWKPKYSIEEGISNFVKHFKNEY